MPPTDLVDLAGHEQVAFCSDPDTGLRAVIALHSTALGPALGGTRFHPYPSMDAALADVLRLSRAMSSKNALAGLEHGGGKAVVIGDPHRDKTPELLRAYGRFVESLAGRYVTACDVGTYVADMDVVAEETRWATGRSPERGGAGDSSVLTAFGVLQGMRAAAQHVWGEPTLAGRRVGLAGVGKVGARLAEHLLEEGADVVVCDVDRSAVDALRRRHPAVREVADAEVLARTDLDIFSPNALGGALDDETVEVLRARVVCGGANNQLAGDGTAQRLARRGIVYTPDYLVNAGGVIQVSDELHGFDLDRARERTRAIFESTLAVLQAADADRVSPAVAADRLAEARIAAGGPVPWLPGRR
ncbi:Glu/Leu/Phe/Val dehydrogenase [Phycicoccus endophyticus]|uniref:Glu/Leu/Phe/Val dehydrogenase n=1 Tax=Phycicoccus endophyticus TaxID=1690220 RepID=A0A7G9R1P9_9MICO|nr:Glu/Leu/Phe/Val dehydrogenase dimerization domain-containing protein [Phycicoccus endophyticus]NHI18684.1 Glu/Leu/Phe/Val dehydrogenase [Phycicoccus endophyticus]QNN49524.1 Glu/Leu/Phe/Val dehydrogenase [Phycicoccus endophyticus]GGL37273.1 valine dehydrogenase [Phycicoccus endophyticus]